MEFYKRTTVRQRGIVWEFDHKETDSGVYSDRLWQWDSDKYDRCCREVWDNTGQVFYNRKPGDIQRFLSLYFEKEVILTQIRQEHNPVNGYDYWLFSYRER